MATAPILPGATIGVVGGGQLGRMLAAVAHRMGYRVVVLTGGAKDTPAGSVADQEIAAGFDDEHAVERFVAEADVITWEFENVDVGLAVVAEAAGVPVRPGPHVITAAQDRALEKAALTAADVPVAPWRPAETEAELVAACRALGGPVIAKTARFGYDGKGQVRIDTPDTAPAAWAALEGRRLVAEQVVPFDRELSVVIARGVDGTTVAHGVMENEHVHHVLDTTITPARVSAAVAEEAVGIAERIVAHLDVVGVLCVELFCTGETLLANEIAPRPHNSGHCTIEAAASSQFEQQLRAVCGLPLGDGACRPAAMVQLLGDLWTDGPPDWASVVADPGVHLHLYGKGDARPGRKMGHLTGVADDPDVALQRTRAARARLQGR